MVTDIFISIIIPTKNAGFWLHKTLTAIVSQTLFLKSEIIIIDSGSTDNTYEILKQFPVKLLQIKPEEFNHGETRNIAVKEARGKYVVMTVQDATAENDQWLQHLLDGFINEKVAGVCGQQIVPHDINMNPVKWFRPQNEPVITEYYFPSPQLFDSLSASQKKNACGWDNVTAMYRKDILLQIPFKKVMFGEDIEWAKDVLLKGYSLVYNYSARVNHYHFETPAFTYKRVYTESFYKYTLFGIKPYTSNHWKDYLRDVKLIVIEKKISMIDKIKWIVHNIELRNKENKAVYEGYKTR
jgi:rhamnosyltransferase